jgi:hypothetical protein
MLLTIFLAIVFCAAITLMLLSAVAFVQKKEFFASAPKEAQEVLLPREQELFYGARVIGWTLMIFSILMIAGVGVISIWDGFRSDFTFLQFFQYYYPEVKSVYTGRKYGYNIKSQLLKLFVIFPAASALAAWICTLFQ